MIVNDLKIFVIGKLCRPWRLVKRKEDMEETIYVLALRHYKLYADVGEFSTETKRRRAILDTRAGSSFIRKSDSPLGTERLITARPSVFVDD